MCVSSHAPKKKPDNCEIRRLVHSCESSVCPHSGAQDLEAVAGFKALVFRPTMFSAMLIIWKTAVFLLNAFVLFSRESARESFDLRKGDGLFCLRRRN